MADDISVLGIAVEQRGVKEGAAALDNLASAGKRAEQSTNTLTGASKKASFEISALAKVAAGAFAGFQIAGLASEFIKTADAMTLMNARLRLVTTSQSEFAAVQSGLIALAKENRVGLGEMADLYTKLFPSVKAAGGGMAETMSIMDSFSKSLTLGGASAMAAASATLQFGQAMGKGKLDGAEFVAVFEASRKTMQAIADGMGVPIGALKELSAQGGLTTEVIGNALMKMNAQLSSELGTLPVTVGNAMQQVRNELSLAVDEIDKAAGISSGLTKQINALSQSIVPLGGDIADSLSTASSALNENKQVILELAAIYASARFGASFGPMIAQTISATAAQAQLTTAVLSGNAVMLGGKEAARQKASADALAAKSSMEAAAAELNATKAKQIALVAAREAAIVRLSEANATVAATASMGAYSAALAANAKAVAAKSAALAELALIGKATVSINAQLAASDAAATAATVAHATASETLAKATAAASISARASAMAMAGLSSSVSFLGGPIGVVITLLGAGATAWALWGREGTNAARSIADELANARGELEKLDRARKFGSGALGEARANLKSAEDRLNTYLGGPTSKEVLKQAYQLVEDRQKIVDELEAQNASFAASADTKPLSAADKLSSYMSDTTNAPRAAKIAAEVEKENKAFEAATKGLSATSEKYQNALKAHTERIAEITKEPKSAGGGSDGIANAVMSSDLARIKRESDQLAAIYAGSERVIEAQHAAGLMSDREYYEAKGAFIRLNAEAQESALQQEISRLAQEQATGKDRIENAQKIADAQAKIEQIRLDAGFATQINETQAAQAIKNTADAYNAAARAAREYLDTVSRQNQRTLNGMGMGTAYREDQAGRNQIEDKFSTRRNQLTDSLLNGEMKQEDYDKYLDLARNTYEEEVRLYGESRAAIRAKQEDWSVGASEAFANYAEEARNVAKQTENLFTNALQAGEDAFVQFAKTGKLSFSDLADSIIADMARIAYRKASEPILSGIGDYISKAFAGFNSGGIDYSMLGTGYVSGARASGGPVASGGTYLVGEKGPELLTMGGNGYITPNNAMGGGNVSVTINNTVSDQAQATVQPRMNNGKLELEVLIQQVMAKDMQQNGRITQGLSNTFGLARAV